MPCSNCWTMVPCFKCLVPTLLTMQGGSTTCLFQIALSLPTDLELWGNHGSFLPPLHQFIEIVFTLERQKLHMEGPDLEDFYIEVK